MKRNIIKRLHAQSYATSPYKKRNFDLANYNKAISSLKYQLTESQTLLSNSSTRSKPVNHSKLVSYPITVHSPDSTWHCSNSLSPLTTPRKGKVFKTEHTPMHKHRPKVNLLSFNKKLRMYIRDGSSDKSRNAFEKIRQQNIEEIYYDYDKNNQRNKKESFSGNNAKALKNKILFVKGVIDYMVPGMLMRKMKYIRQKKEQEFQDSKIKHKANAANDVYLKTVPSANDKVKYAKYSINAVGRGGIINMKQRRIKRA